MAAADIAAALVALDRPHLDALLLTAETESAAAADPEDRLAACALTLALRMVRRGAPAEAVAALLDCFRDTPVALEHITQEESHDS